MEALPGVFFAVCARAFSSCGKQGYPLVVVHGLLIVVVPLVGYRL